MSALAIFLLVLLGILAGSLSGLLGIGGGVILVPALVFGFGLSQHCAEGTTLALMIPPIGLLAAWTYYRKGYVNLKIAALVCVGFAAGGFLGAKLALGLSSAMLERIFGVALVFIGGRTLLTPRASATPELAAPPTNHPVGLLYGCLLVLLGVLAGAASGLLGIGGGVIMVPALRFLFGLSQHESQGTTLALMVPPIGLLAAMQYYSQGDVHLQMAAIVCGGFFCGGLLGARLAAWMPSHVLSRIFGIAMLLIALKMLLM